MSLTQDGFTREEMAAVQTELTALKAQNAALATATPWHIGTYSNATILARFAGKNVVIAEGEYPIATRNKA